MASGIDDSGKTVRNTLSSLFIKVTNDELKYRSKYLPDPKQLTDDKIVCTVCSVSLASRVRKGKTIHVHALLGVLLCKDCHDFYGDGIFSTDEDGEDKYCRWCGQGGTLYLCSQCNCGFCKKCMTKNMKNSALAAIEDDDWKCLICVPRPIFGSRAVCWASKELNSSIRKDELFRLRLKEEKDKLETEQESVKRSSRTKKRSRESEDSDSSTIYIPHKKRKEDPKSIKTLNGNVKKHKRKNESSSSEIQSSDNDHSARWEKRKRKKQKKRKCSSSEESSTTTKKNNKQKHFKKSIKDSEDSSGSDKTVPKYKKKNLKKSIRDSGDSSEYDERVPKSKKKNLNKSKKDSGNSSDSDKTVPKSKNRNLNKSETDSRDSSDSDEIVTKTKSKKKNSKKTKQASEDLTESDEMASKSKSSKISSKKLSKHKRRKKQSKRINGSSSDSSSNESVNKRKPKSKKKVVRPFSDSSSEENNKYSDSDKKQINEGRSDKFSDSCLEADVNNKKLNGEEEKFESSIGSKSHDTTKEIENEISRENPSLGNLVIRNESSPTRKLSAISPDLVNGVEAFPVIGQPENEGFPPEEEEVGDYTLSYHGSATSNDAELPLSQEDEVKVKVHLAIEWLDGVVSDISDLGCLISEHTNKFGERKVNMESLNSYDDVLSTLGKLKRFLGGIHTNYKQIEENLEDKLKSWKLLAGLEDCELEEQVDDVDNETQTADEAPVETVPNEAEVDTGTDENVLPDESALAEAVEGEINSSVLPEGNSDKAIAEIEETSDCNKTHVEDPENEDAATEEAQKIIETENKPEESENESLLSANLLEGFVHEKDESMIQSLENEHVDNPVIKEEPKLKSGGSNFLWYLFSSDEDSNLNDETSSKQNCNDANSLDAIAKPVSEDEISHSKEGFANEDAENLEALQELLCSSTEPEVGSSESDSDDSDDIQLDDSDLEDILKPRKYIVKKSNKQKELKGKEESKSLNAKIDSKDKEDQEEDVSDKKEAEGKTEEPLDSEAEIDMLTDLSKLKKKTVYKRLDEEESSDESSFADSEDSEDDGTEDQNEKKKRKKYKTECKERREKERNELFGFLEGESSADEVDITKKDLDVMEDQLGSESNDSMNLESFSRKMAEKWQELEKEQDQLNLERLLASESDQGSDGGDDFVLESDEDKKKKEKKTKQAKKKEESPERELAGTDDPVVEVKEEKEDVTEAEREKKDGSGTDQEYEQFMEGINKSRNSFTGLGSSSEEDKGDIEIKEEPLDDEAKKEFGSNEEESNSDSDSSDLFLDITKKKKSDKKAIWRQHKLLRMKLSDTDTSDEERWWKRRLEREKKKKEEEESDSSVFDEFSQARSSKKSLDCEKKKGENGSDKENKKIKKEKKKQDKEEEDNSSSTLEMSSTDSSGSEVFKKKKRKKKESSDSDVQIISDNDKKKKKKKKKVNLSGDSTDDSEGSDDDVIDITQKSSQGESPGKGGRKNIRKVLTKHELAAATKAAAKEEEERKKRIAARQKLFNEMFEIKEAEVLEKLVLDFDPETKTELISVNKDLVTKMKPHQAKGVKFMWDSCFESLNQLRTKKGSGCILAHCMGLGKTFQVVSLVHTILTHKDTNVKTVLVVCPLSTVLNWFNEFDKWLDDVAGGRDIKVYHLTKHRQAHERSRQLSLWHRTGGVMIIGYEMFRMLANPNCKKYRLHHTKVFQETLIDPGADLVVCDEGHMLKNESTQLSKAMSRIRTLRRIVLTGTPMQNNLKEYHCMVQFVKPNLLGTRREFLNQFVNPITNGQFVDSTEADVKVMKRRAHVLHKMLEGLVQRFDYSVLTPFLPPKHEYVISLKLSDIQVKLYQFYLDYFCQRNSDDKRTSSQLFQDWQVLGRIWTHPRVLKMSYDKMEKERQSSDSEEEGKRLRAQRTIRDFLKKKEKSSSPSSSKQESDDEGSLKDFINDNSSSSLSSSSDDETGAKKDKSEQKKEMLIKKDEEPKKDTKVTCITTVNLIDGVDEINLISSEEDDCDKNEVEEVKENQNADVENEVENKANDSGIEDQEGKPEDKENISEEHPAGNDAEDGSEKENKESEKENKDSEKENKGSEKENKDSEKKNKENENKEEKCENKKKVETEQLDRKGGWWKEIIEPQHLEDINQSAKLVVLFAILRECEMIEDKVLVFSQSLFSLDLIEYFLKKVDQATEENRLDESLGNNAGCWQKGLDYFRLDGSSSSENRSAWCKSFNKENNPRARLFLISTKAGGLGINLTGANRVVIFDASWNPSHDIQSIFRIYRFGQKKPCYVYRFVAHGTMEEKVYDRQVAKQLLSSRVVDEQQVQRHFSMSDLNELYTFTPPQERLDKPIPALPKDRLMAELLTQYNDWIEKYHEHDSLLENIAEEELNEEERKLAWEDYENEKKRGFITPAPGGFAGGSGFTNFPAMTNQIEMFRKSLKMKFPDATEVEMSKMIQTLMYQVSYRPLDQQTTAQQQSSRTYAAASQQQPNFRSANSNNMGSNTQFAEMVQKMNQKINPFPLRTSQSMQQRSGTSQVSQQRPYNPRSIPNQSAYKPIVGNREIKMTNKTGHETYMDQMRKQQQANLQRIQNQKRFQQGQQSAQQPGAARNDRQPPQPYRPTNNRLAPPFLNPVQSRVQTGNNQWKPNVPVPSRTQQAQKQRENAVNILGRRQQVPPAAIGTNRQQPQRGMEKQKWQEEMKQRISQMKQQVSLQDKVAQRLQKTAPTDERQKKRQLEEMKKRYDASRKRQSSGVSSAPISIVELDDEPGT